MRFKGLFIILILLFTISLGLVASAADSFRLTEAASNIGFTDNASYSDVRSILSLAVNLTLSLLAIIFFGMMMYAGIRWITAQGEDEKIEKAKTAIKAAIIGMVIVISSYALTQFIFKVMDLGGAQGWCEVTDSQSNTTCYNITKQSCDAYGNTGVFNVTKPGICGGASTKNECKPGCISPQTCISGMCI